MESPRGQRGRAAMALMIGLVVIGSGFLFYRMAPIVLGSPKGSQALASPSVAASSAAHSTPASVRKSGGQPTRSPGASSTASPTPTPNGTSHPTPTPTPHPTPTPTPQPTPTPSASPRPSPSPSPTPTPQPTPTPPPSPTVIFDDEFNGTALDTNAWVALNRPGDASNSELECYKPSNAAVSGGALVLTTKVDSSCTGYRYTSAFVQWRSFNFLYGTVTIRAREAGGTGTWPALWLLGANCQQTNVSSPDNTPPCNWPQPGSDEIDMTEILGSNHTAVNQQIHSSLGNPGCSAQTSDVSLNWHVYTLVWQPGSVTWKIDGVTTCTITQAVPSHRMFLMMNTAVGGQGGTVNDATLPQTHSIDYVHVTQ